MNSPAKQKPVMVRKTTQRIGSTNIRWSRAAVDAREASAAKVRVCPTARISAPAHSEPSTSPAENPEPISPISVAVKFSIPPRTDNSVPWSVFPICISPNPASRATTVPSVPYRFDESA